MTLAHGLHHHPLVAGGATSAAATNTLNHLILLQLGFRYSAYARCVEIRLFGLYTS